MEIPVRDADYWQIIRARSLARAFKAGRRVTVRDVRLPVLTLCNLDRVHRDAKPANSFYELLVDGEPLKLDPKDLLVLETLATPLALEDYGPTGINNVPVVPAAPPMPPIAGERIIALLGGEMAEAILGDLAEKFEERVERIGETRARAWYWWQATRSVGSFVGRWTRRLIEIEALLQRIGL
jgi:hypothetical protein